MSCSQTPSKRHTALAVSICAAALIYVFPHFSALNNPNENVRFYMTAALAEQGTYEIDAMRARWGWVNDAACVERGGGAPPSACVSPRPRPGRTRHYYSVKAPGTSLLGVPFYAAYRATVGDQDFDREDALWATRMGATILPMLVFFAFFHRFLHRHYRSPVLADAAFFSTTLGSVLLGYTYLFASHAPSAAAAFAAFGLLAQGRRHGLGAGASFAAGLCAAGASFFEYPAFIASAILSLYALWTLRPWRRVATFAVGALLPTLAMMHFQWHAFDNAFSPGHLFVENASFRALHEQGFFGSSGFHREAAFRLLFDLRLGLLTTSPLLVFAPAGWFLLMRDRRHRGPALVAGAICLLTYLMICTMVMWDGGWAIGPRYLVLTLPFLSWLSLHAVDVWARRWPQTMHALAVGTLVAGFVVSGLFSMYYPHLPPEIDHPLSQLFSVLLTQDFAPPNAANLLGVFGTLSMAPMALLALAVSGILARRARLAGAGTLAAAALAAALVVPRFLLPVPAQDHSRTMVRFIVEHWSPAGHDRATRLRDEILRRGETTSDADWLELARLYRAQGRDRVAALAEAQVAH